MNALSFNIAGLFIFMACQNPMNNRQHPSPIDHQQPADQIADYVVELFEDSKGNLWMGTMSKGVARYQPSNDPDKPGKLEYFTTDDGLADNTVASITEDNQGNIWLGTHNGISLFDGNSFTNYTVDDGLCHFRVSNLLIDSNNKLWVGTWGGICTMEGDDFMPFPLPTPDVELKEYQTTMDWVTEIIEDSKGNIWIGRDGYGLCQYDGNDFQCFTKKDGLLSNNVQSIQQDMKGNVWVGSRIVERDHPDPDQRIGNGGLSVLFSQNEDPSDFTFTSFPDYPNLYQTETYSLLSDSKGNVWIGSNGNGLIKHDGNTFGLIDQINKKDLTPHFGIQAIEEDHQGRLWIGMSGGLFRLENDVMVNVTQNGPWN